MRFPSAKSHHGERAGERTSAWSDHSRIILGSCSNRSKQVTTSPPWNGGRLIHSKTWFGHRSGWSPCAHSISKFFLCYKVLFSSETSAPGLPGSTCIQNLSYFFCFKCFTLRPFFSELQETVIALQNQQKNPCNNSNIQIEITSHIS